MLPFYQCSDGSDFRTYKVVIELFFSSIFSISFSIIIIYLLSDLSPLSVSLRVSVNTFPSSNYANVITSPVCSLEDVAYWVYVTVRRIGIASTHGRDVYDNALEKLSSNTKSYDEITFLVLGTYRRYPF